MSAKALLAPLELEARKAEDAARRLVKKGMVVMSKKVVAVCACPVGAAHTYLAADKFTKAAEKAGFEVKVETQGLTGVEDELSEEDIEEADYVVLANEVPLEGEERFEDCEDKTIHCRIAELVHDSAGFIAENLV